MGKLILLHAWMMEQRFRHSGADPASRLSLLDGLHKSVMADAAKVKELREHFLNKYSGSILDDTFDERDVNCVKKNDAFIENVLKTHKCKGDIKKGADLINEILLFRAKYRLQDLKESELNRELMDKNCLQWHGVDKNGRKILIFRVAANKKGYLVEESRQIIAYFLNSHYQHHTGEKVVFIFDFTDAGVGNMDLDVSKFIVLCGNTYFPEMVEYSLNFKMGLALEAIWTIISGWFDPHQAKSTKMVTRSNIQEYVNKDQLLPHMIKEEK